MTRRTWLNFGVLLIIWVVLIGWQMAEHVRVRHAAERSLINRGRAICNTVGLLMRSQRPFGYISKEKFESALTQLVMEGEPMSVQLLNNQQEVVASAGEPIDTQMLKDLQDGVSWGAQSVMLENLVDLGTNVTQDLERTNLTASATPVLPISEIEFLRTNRQAGGPWMGNTNFPNGFRRRGRPFDLRRLSEEERQLVLKEKGVHSFLIVMSNQSFRAQNRDDLLMRSIIAVLATVSVMGFGMALRNVDRSAELQIRLVRASELNSHLKEMNLAAAGLAHETRNPLNIIRGLAQMIARQQDALPEIRKQCRDMIDETDRVTAQLNEFINYSRPREIRYSHVSLRAITAEVVRTLGCDIEEKNIQLRGIEDELFVKADEALLRQALFNLVLNAIQAVSAKGEIQIVARRENAAEAMIEVRDDGPGVAADQRAEVFKPYFTTNKKGTGLGLAVVHQIVLAHGWEIECLPNEPKGAVFRISHMKQAS